MDILTYGLLNKKIEEAKNVSGEKITEAVNDYLNENPPTTGATAEQASQIDKNESDIGELKSDLTDHSKVLRINIIGVDFDDNSYRSYITGGLNTLTGWCCTKLIPIIGGCKYNFSENAHICFFDSNRNFISGTLTHQSTGEYTTGVINTPANARYITCSFEMRFKERAILLIGESDSETYAADGESCILRDLLLQAIHSNKELTTLDTANLTDANNAAVNTIYTIVGINVVSNMPNGTDGQGTLITYGYNTNSQTGCSQIFISSGGNRLFFRIKWSEWSDWTQVSTNIRENGVYGNDKYTSSVNQDLADANSALNNTIYSISSAGIVSNMPSGTDGQGTLITFAINNSVTAGKFQVYSTVKGKVYTRFYWTSWSDWHTSYESEENFHSVPEYANTLYTCFHTVGCIGDSLASGECYSNETGTPIPHDLYEYSWGQCMARRSGCTYYNFSRGGMTAGSWLTDENYGYALANDGNHVCDAYIIGLGVNDSNYYKDKIGTISDVHIDDSSLNPDTFYGNYGKIISLMLEINPRAKFFCLTAYMGINVINNAIREIVNYFNANKDLTMCHLIDLNVNYADVYKDSFIIDNTRYNHYNALAYNYMANILINEINYIMYTNYDAFKQIEFSQTNYSWTE